MKTRNNHFPDFKNAVLRRKNSEKWKKPPTSESAKSKWEAAKEKGRANPVGGPIMRKPMPVLPEQASSRALPGGPSKSTQPVIDKPIKRNLPAIPMPPKGPPGLVKTRGGNRTPKQTANLLAHNQRINRTPSPPIKRKDTTSPESPIKRNLF